MAARSAPTASTSPRPRPARRSRSSRCPAPTRRPARPSMCRAIVEKADELKAAGVDEIWCVSVNDAFVMGAWGRDQKTAGKVRMMADGSADFAKATGLTLDLTARGMGLRSQPLLDAGRRRRGQDAECRRPGQVRGQRRADDAGPGQGRARLNRRMQRPALTRWPLSSDNRKLRRISGSAILGGAGMPDPPQSPVLPPASAGRRAQD